MPEKNTTRHRLDAEIFAVGTWNGQTFSKADLEQIAANFEALKAQLKPPVKMGHNDKQRMTDGAPALGWVEGLKVVGDKLVATLADVPTVVMEAIRKRLYRRVSAEIYTDVRVAGKNLGKALKAVALLGADIPAVSTLADLDAFLATAPGLAVGEFAGVASFSAIAGAMDDAPNPHSEETTMTKEEIAALVNDAVGKATQTFSEKLNGLEATNKTLADENTGLKAKLAEFTTAEETRKTTEAKAAVDAKRTQAKALFEQAVQQEIMLPRERESALALFNLDDDAAVEKLDLEKVQAFINSRGKTLKLTQEKGMGNGGDGGGGADQYPNPSFEVSAKADALAVKNNIPYTEALQQVLRTEPQLAASYKQFTQQYAEGGTSHVS